MRYILVKYSHQNTVHFLAKAHLSINFVFNESGRQRPVKAQNPNLDGVRFHG